MSPLKRKLLSNFWRFCDFCPSHPYFWNRCVPEITKNDVFFYFVEKHVNDDRNNHQCWIMGENFGGAEVSPSNFNQGFSGLFRLFWNILWLFNIFLLEGIGPIRIPPPLMDDARDNLFSGVGLFLPRFRLQFFWVGKKNWKYIFKGFKVSQGAFWPNFQGVIKI